MDVEPSTSWQYWCKLLLLPWTYTLLHCIPRRDIEMRMALSILAWSCHTHLAVLSWVDRSADATIWRPRVTQALTQVRLASRPIHRGASFYTSCLPARLDLEATGRKKCSTLRQHSTGPWQRLQASGAATAMLQGFSSQHLLHVVPQHASGLPCSNAPASSKLLLPCVGCPHC